MKNNELTIFKKFSFKKMFYKILVFFNKNNTSLHNIPEVTEKTSDQKKDEFLKNISFKQNEEEKAMIDKVKINHTILRTMNLEELKELNKAISNWKIYLRKRIKAAKDIIGL